MNLLRKVQFIALLGACMMVSANAKDGSSLTSIDVSPAELAIKPIAANWTSYNGDYSGRRYSSLSEIDTSNVDKLAAKWVFHAQNSNRLEVTPVVVNGMMFA